MLSGELLIIYPEWSADIGETERIIAVGIALLFRMLWGERVGITLLDKSIAVKKCKGLGEFVYMMGNNGGSTGLVSVLFGIL